MPRISALALAIFLQFAAAMPSAQTPSDWSDSPEALFLTVEERREWAALTTYADRERFKERYWLRRDPTPRTPGNEFRDGVLGRIRRADERFPLKGQPGSQTARGRAFVLLGTPARVRDTGASRPPPSRPGTPPTSEVGLLEGIETMVVWGYDRERTPALLDAIGRPMLELTFIIEPQRGTDRLQQPGLFNQVRETLAALSIVTAVRTQAPSSGASAAPLDAGARERLAAAPAQAQGIVSGHTVLWSDSVDPELHAWVFLPGDPHAQSLGLRFHAVVHDGAGNEVAAWSEAASLSPGLFSTSAPGAVFSIRRPLPVGRHRATFGFSSGARWHATTSTEIAVPNLGGGEFAVSPLVVSAGPSAHASGLSLARLPARADATFATNESLWAVIELANAPPGSEMSIELTLERDNRLIGGTGEQQADLVQTAEGRHLAAFELPLSTLAPGEYLLHAAVRPKAGSEGGKLVRALPIRLIRPEGIER